MSEKVKVKKKRIAISFSEKKFLLIIFLLALILRLYKITNPVLDWHAFRQADTASVTREFLKQGINLLEPKYHDLSNIQSGFDNPNGYRMVEFPFINAGIAFILKLTSLPLVPTSRFVSVLFSLGTLFSLFFLVKMLSGKTTAYLTSLSFVLLPYSIFYSRVVLPEPAFLFFSCFSLFTFAKFLEKARFKFFLISLISLALSLLLKPFVAFLAPVYFALTWNKYKFKTFLRFKFYLFAILSVIPFFLWRYWIVKFPEGIPASDWLFNSDHLRFKGAWFRWLFYERISKLILGFFGTIFLPFNFLNKEKDILVYGAWWLGIMAYFAIVSTGNIRHDYYQVLTIPIICISVARGVVVLRKLIANYLKNIELKEKFNKINLAQNIHQKIANISILVLYMLSLTFAWREVKGYYNVNHWEYYRTGLVADEILPKDAKVIAHAMGDTQFLFQTNRRGWPIGFDIEEKIKMGANYYLTTSYDGEAQELEKQYLTVSKTKEYLILDLTQEIVE
ncbi:MAG: glycosyltransferase family 39 protein [Candidatus Woesebacteria bacterium]|jgi:hypothetical protein